MTVIDRRPVGRARHQDDLLSEEQIASATPQQLAEGFMPFAARIAHGLYPDDPDAVSDAYLGLVQAARSYDPKKGKFTAWAKLYVRQACIRGYFGRALLITPPIHAADRLSALLSAESELSQNNQHEPTLEDLAEASGMPLRWVEIIRGPALLRLHNMEQDSIDIQIRSDTDLVSDAEARMLLADLLTDRPEATKDVERWLFTDGTEDGLQKIVADYWGDDAAA